MPKAMRLSARPARNHLVKEPDTQFGKSLIQSLTQIAPPLWKGLGPTLWRLSAKPSVDELNQAARKSHLVNANGKPLVFIEQTTPFGQRDYEAQIFHQAQVPTRAGHWHDVFNACMWLTYPATKAALNAVHLRQPDTSERTPASDAATLFDESGAVLIGPDPRLAQWLIDHDWHAAFVEHRQLWDIHHLLIIGHAVLEKLANPYPGMIAKVIYQPWTALSETDINTPPAGLDLAIAKRWDSDEFTRPSQLFPVPVLGVPDADPANADPSYYDDADVFRAKRQR